MYSGVPPEKSLRSVFVGNIPYDATEEELKDRFSAVGPVQSFRLVYDRDSGKPKGYGFCEYKDQETAQSAMRNLGNVEIGGRTLRVDSAANEKNRQQMDRDFSHAFNAGPSGPMTGGPPMMQGLQGMSGPPMAGVPGLMEGSSPFGPDIEPERAPEAISSVVASLPPEQMYELAKQMKHCVQNNPLEAREMLIQNPQLTYALLQALVVMKVVDPQVAMGMLHREGGAPFVPPAVVGQGVPGFGSPLNDFRTGGGMPVDPRRDPRMQPRQDPRLAAPVDEEAQRSAILNQVANLTDAEIAQLPPDQRNAVILLKQEIAHRGMH